MESVQDIPTMSLPTKYELNPISGLSANARKLLEKSEAMKRWQFSGACVGQLNLNTI